MRPISRLTGATAGIALCAFASIALVRSSEPRRRGPAVALQVAGGITGAEVPPFGSSEKQRLVIVLDSAAAITCEDLGRQLRELVGARAARDRIVLVATPRADSALVALWISRERIGVAGMITMDSSLVVGGKAISPPAALVLDRPDHVYKGVTHPVKVPNTRPVSFASELDSL